MALRGFSMPSPIRGVSLTAFVVFATLVCPRLCSQTPGVVQPLPNHSPNGFAGAENRWRLTAADLQSQNDEVSPSIRRVRNDFWRPILQDYRNLEINGKTVGISEGPPSISEIIDDSDAIWTIATFDHFLVIPTDSSQDLLYTEMKFKVSSIIKGTKTASLSPGELFDVDTAGGRILNLHREVVSRLIAPRSYFVQPGHTYLMEIKPHIGGSYVIAKEWDVTSGKVVPDESGEISRATYGSSKLIGMTTEDAVRYLKTVLSKN